MKYKVYWEQTAVDRLAELFAVRPRDAQRLVVVVRTFGRDGVGDTKKIQGRSDAWRLRSGDWRVFLAFEDDEIYIADIENRRDAY